MREKTQSLQKEQFREFINFVWLLARFSTHFNVMWKDLELINFYSPDFRHSLDDYISYELKQLINIGIRAIAISRDCDVGRQKHFIVDKFNSNSVKSKLNFALFNFSHSILLRHMNDSIIMALTFFFFFLSQLYTYLMSSSNRTKQNEISWKMKQNNTMNKSHTVNGLRT